MKNTLTGTRTIDGFAIKFQARYIENLDCWLVNVSHKGSLIESRETRDAWKEIQDMVELALDDLRAKRHDKRIADHIDGYDRDDLGESPD